MDCLEYINLLKDKFTKHFDIFENHRVENCTIPLLAKSVVRNERYVFSKNHVLDAYENFEYCFVNYKEKNIDEDEIIAFIKLLKSSVKNIVHPDEEHMSTEINGIYITNTGFTQECIKRVEKFKFHKNFTFGLKGWCDIALILVDLNEEKVYTNKQGKQFEEFYLSIFKNQIVI